MIKIDIFTNLITPFDIDDMIDYQALDNHIEKLVNQGNNKFIIGSRTGEAASLTFLEQKHLLRYVCYHYPGLEIYMQLSESCTKKVTLSQSSNILYKLRLPLVKISDESKEQLNKIMEKY